MRFIKQKMLCNSITLYHGQVSYDLRCPRCGASVNKMDARCNICKQRIYFDSTKSVNKNCSYK